MSEPMSVSERAAFDEYLLELAATWYDQDLTKAFRHAAFQQVVPDPLADAQVIELTRIDRPGGDLEVDGWHVDEAGEGILLFQSLGGEGKAAEGKLAKFWDAPDEILRPERVQALHNPALEELSKELLRRLSDGFDLRLVFASRGGFQPAAELFAQPKVHGDRSFDLPDGSRITCRCTLELRSFDSIGKAFNDVRAGFRTSRTTVELEVGNWQYEVDTQGERSMRATVKASEIVRVFRLPGMGFRLFSLNPRGPLANAKVNKNIATTLETPVGRKRFHLLNNGLCATCDEFNPLSPGVFKVENLQIVNGCQTTVTLDHCSDEDLAETMVDFKLTVADRGLAEQIASSSNSQTALKAKDYASFDKRQRMLQYDFEHNLQPPWYYEIKQGYWKVVLSDVDKARFKTGRRKRHIEVQPLAQASLAFTGHPSEALDKVRFVFEGIRSPEERESYERAFPDGVRVEQLLLAWSVLDWLGRREVEVRYSTYHLLDVVASLLKQKYGVSRSDFLSPSTSVRLIDQLDGWMPNLHRIARNSVKNAFRRAQGIRPLMDARDFFRGAEFSGTSTDELIAEAAKDELETETDLRGNPLDALPN